MTADDMRQAFKDFQRLGMAARIPAAGLDSARQRFWRLYPGSPGLEEAARNLARLLAAKDYWYLTMAFANRSQGLRSNPSGAGWDFILGGSFGEGISQRAAPLFLTWVDSALATSTAVLRTPMSTPEDAASARSITAYREYAKVRDMEELFRGPKSPLASSDPETYLTGAFTLCQTWPSMAAARAQYTVVLRILGEAAVRESSALLRQEMSPSDCSASDPAALGLRRTFGRTIALHHLGARAFAARRTTTDPATYLMLLLVVPSKGDWALLGRWYDDLVARHGHELTARLEKALRSGDLPDRCTFDSGPNCLEAFLAGGASGLAAAIQREATGAAERKAALNEDPALRHTQAYWEARTSRGQWLSDYKRREYIFLARLKLIPDEVELVPAWNLLQGYLSYWYETDDNSRTAEGDRRSQQKLSALMTQLREQCSATGSKMSAVCLMSSLAEDTYPHIR